MIQTQTKLRIIDNSGARTSQCIKVLGGFKKRYAKVGDSIITSTKKVKSGLGANTRSKVKKGSVNKAVVLRTTKPIHRKDGSTIKFSENAAMLLNQQGNPVGTRIIGLIPKELKKYKGTRIASIASGTI
jgi:large subunit ribosomal protein L14